MLIVWYIIYRFKEGVMKMSKRTLRILTIIFAIVCVLALFVQTLSFLNEADHHCSGGACPLCLSIAARDTLAALISAAVLTALFVCVFIAVRHLVSIIADDTGVNLVYLKVKLSN